MNIGSYAKVNHMSIDEQLKNILSNDNYDSWTKETIDNLYDCASGEHGRNSQSKANNLLSNFIEYVNNYVMQANKITKNEYEKLVLRRHAEKCIKKAFENQTLLDTNEMHVVNIKKQM